MHSSRRYLLVACLIVMFMLGVITVHLHTPSVSHIPTQQVACGGLVVPGCL